jgi:putative NADH-flavin reductase
MKLVIFGSTAGTGRKLVEQALEQSHDVSAFARTAEKIDDLEYPNLQVIQGNVLDSAAVAAAVAGQEAVFCTIGGGARRTTLREDATRNILQAMDRTGVQRLICQSSLGVGDSRANLGSFTKHVIVGLFLRHAFADHERQEAVIKQSSLKWTIVRPPHLLDTPQTGIYRHGFPPTDRDIKGQISRADVADFMLKQLTDDSYVQRTPGVSY